MVPVTTLRAGSTFEQDGKIFQVLTYEHLHLRKTSAVVKVKVKNLKTQAFVEKSFASNKTVNPIRVEKKDLQFLYKDKDTAQFMDPKTFDQSSISLKQLDGYQYLKEGQAFTLSFFGNEPLSIDLPPKMEFKVTETGPGVKGNSATNIFKDAILENGLKTKVPLFVNTNDVVRIDTRTGAYTQKA